MQSQRSYFFARKALFIKAPIVQDCLEGDLPQFILEKERPESEFRFEGMDMNIPPIISLFDFK